jgi:hypothetical protein
MSDDIDYDLTVEQWETLKSLRTPVLRLSASRGFALEDLVALGLATISENVAAMIMGCCRLTPDDFEEIGLRRA